MAAPHRKQLEDAADATLRLKVPQGKPEKATRRKALADVEKVYRELRSQTVRDVIRLRIATGLHHSEIRRIAQGESEITRLEDPGIATTVRFVHKTGAVHVVSLDTLGLAAAERLRERGRTVGQTFLNRACRKAGERTGLSYVFLPGDLRHTFATAARDSGTLIRPSAASGGGSVEAVSEILGHRSQRTTRSFYLDTAVPPRVELPLTLYHPDDPPA